MEWRSKTFSDVLAQKAREYPDTEAIVIGDTGITYKGLWCYVRQIAAAMQAMGLRHGDHVAICMGNSIEWAAIFYAASAIGAITVPVNTRLKADEIEFCLRQSRSKALFVVDRFRNVNFGEMLCQIFPELTHASSKRKSSGLEHVVVLGGEVPSGAISYAGLLRDQSSENFSPVAVMPDDVVLIQYTSGTTSFPKGAMLTHDNMLRNAAAVLTRFECRAGERYFNAQPFFHVSGTTLALLVSLSSGASLYSLPNFEPGEALRVMSTRNCLVTSGNETMFLMMINHPGFDHYQLRLRNAWTSSGPEISRKIIERLGIKTLCHAYGLSEASPNVAMSFPDDDMEKSIQGWAHVQSGLEVQIRDPETGFARSPGLEGEICIRGWCVMKGYFDMPELSAKAIDAEGWLHTGDIGVMDDEGRLRFISRIKDVIRVGGENVAPAEVENMLLRHPKIAQAQVFSVPDMRLMEVPAAYVVLAKHENATVAELISWGRQHMANFRAPRYLKIVDSFESFGMTGSGKVQKNHLQKDALLEFGLMNPEGKNMSRLPQ